MSRNFFPVVLAVGLGVFTGYYTFQPALKSLQEEHKATTPQQNRLSPEEGRQEPSSKPVTIQDPSSTPRNTWTERIWGAKKTAAAETIAPPVGFETSASAPGKDNNKSDNQQ